MRHPKKVEESDSNSDLDQPEISKQATTNLRRELHEENQANIAEDIVAVHDGTNDDQHYILKETKLLSLKQKKALYNDADWAFIVTKETWPIMRLGLDSLVRKGGVYYSVYERSSNPFQLIIVLYLEDNILDLMAECLKIKCRMTSFDVIADFQCFASDKFEQFNARQHQSILMQTMETEFDMDYLIKSKVIIDNFPVHDKDRHTIIDSFHDYKYPLIWGFVFRGFLTEM